MVYVKREGVILEPSNLAFESKGVFNPACVKKGSYVHMFYRAWSRDSHSTVGYCRLKGPLKVVKRSKKPVIYPEASYELNIEDPRIVFLGGKYYMTYIAYDGRNVRIAYAISKDLKKFRKIGIISPEITYDEAENIFRACESKLKERYFLFESYFKDIVGHDALLWDKDAMLFPKKIGGKFALLHRILPDMQVIYFRKFKDLKLDYWKQYFRRLSDYVVLESEYWYENRNIGGGAPPIETDRGWLIIYHAVDDMDRGKIYRAGAALLDKKNPSKVIGHLKEPLFSPKEDYETKGNVSNVVFPTGTAQFGDRLYIYYGAADQRIAAASVDMDELLDELAGGNKK